MNAQLHCSHQNQCSVCLNFGAELSTEADNKKSDFQTRWKSAFAEPCVDLKFSSVPQIGFRDRSDLTVENGKIGFYKKDGPEIFELLYCPLLNPRLNEFLEKLRNLPWPKKRGSLRIRVSPIGELGVWLDFSNEEIKNLLDSRTLLEELTLLSVVEIGQRKKVLIQKPQGELGLGPPIPNPWTKTFLSHSAIDLYLSIGTFSQTGIAANKLIASGIRDLFITNEVRGKSTLEFGCGIGTLSFPLSEFTEKMTCLESDAAALLGFETTLKNQAGLGTKNNFHLIRGDFQKSHSLDVIGFDVVAINPPRSGMKSFLDGYFKNEKAKLAEYVFYMSCYADSFFLDAVKLKNLGYKMTAVELIDQFPFTEHYEILSLWRMS